MHEPRDDLLRFEEAMEAAGMAWWEMELPRGVVFFGANKAKMLGYDKENFFHYTDFTRLLHPDDEPKAMQAMQDHIDGKLAVYETKYRIRAKNGEYLTFYDRGRITQQKGGVIRVAGIVLNVSTIEKYFAPIE